ncbi:MAG: hypothetical protein AAGA99_21130 [Actinomycetota bacterium]
MATTAEGLLLADRYQVTLSGLVRQLGTVAEQRFRFHLMQASGDIEGAWQRWLDELAPQVEGITAQAAQMADAYVAAMTTLETGIGTSPIGLRPADYTATATRGTDVDELRRRPLVTVLGALSRGVQFDQAVAQGAQRAVSTLETDVQLAARAASRDAMSADERIVGYRRTLSGTENCGLCVAASTQRYRTGDLMPIHARCDCGVEPIYGTRDPGQVIDRDTLRTLSEQSGGLGSRSQLARQRFTTADLPEVEVVDHGELGPTLTSRQHAHSGPNEI